MLLDPITITVNAVAKVMARVIASGQSATYQLPDKTFRVEISHQAQKRAGKDRTRTRVRFVQRAIVPDPLTSVNDWEEYISEWISDLPVVGFSSTQIAQHNAGFFTWLNTQMVQLYGQES